MRKLSRKLAILAAACCLPAAASAQEPAGELAERIEVSVVEVEVFVTDREGKRVTGLEREDFELRVGGRRVPISNFYAVGPPVGQGDTVPDADASDAEAREGTSAAPPAAAEADRPEQERVRLMVYFDHANLRQSHQQRVAEDLGTFLDQRLARGDEVMLVGHGRGLYVAQPLTAEAALVRAGLERLASEASGRQRRDTAEDLTERRVEQALADGDPGAARSHRRHQQQIVRAETEEALQALRRALETFAGVEGRKAMLYVSDGLPRSADSAGSLIRAVSREANAQQVTLYTLDAVGQGSGGDLQRRRLEQPALDDGLDTARREQGRFDEQESLLEMSELTGGSALVGTSNFSATLAGTAGRDFDSFYSLGFDAGRIRGEGEQRIEVKVRRPGLTVRHRSAFHPRTQAEGIEDRVVAALVLGAGENRLRIALQPGEPEREKKGRYRLPLRLHVPVAEVVLLPEGDRLRGDLVVYVAVRDEEGRLSEVQELPYPIDLPAEHAPHPSQIFAYETALLVEPGEQTVAVGLWDRLAGNQSFVRATVRIDSNKKE